MKTTESKHESPHGSKTALLDAAMRLIRTKGYSATRIEDICEAAGPAAPWSAESLALYIQAVIQGAFILAKAKQGPKVAAECLRHLRRYLESQFTERLKEAARQA